MCVLLRWWSEHYCAIPHMVGQVYFLEMSQRISLSILCNLCFLGRNGHKLAWNFSKIQSLYIRHWLSIRNAFSTEEGKVTNVLFSLQVSSFSLAHVSFSLTSNQILFLLTYNYCTSSLWYFVQILPLSIRLIICQIWGPCLHCAWPTTLTLLHVMRISSICSEFLSTGSTLALIVYSNTIQAVPGEVVEIFWVEG